MEKIIGWLWDHPVKCFIIGVLIFIPTVVVIMAYAWLCVKLILGGMGLL